MQQWLMNTLKCPVCKASLQLQVFNTAPKEFRTGDQMLVESGVLTCTCSFIFPIVEFIPRMLIESFLDHESFLSSNVVNFAQRKQELMSRHGRIITAAINRNKATKTSFTFEWSLLKGNNEERIWRLNEDEYKAQLFDELNLSPEYLNDKIAIDVGCGHGRSTMLLSEKCAAVIGMDLGLSVEKACQNNKRENCHFIQADLHYPPFCDHTFDVVYSSGVLHHTSNTETAFNVVSSLVKPGGVYCVWLYKRGSKRAHRLIIGLRQITKRMPLKLQFWLYLIVFVPVHKLISLSRHRKSAPWREIMIELLDTFSPQYRFEHEPDEVKQWFSKNGFKNINVTTVNDIGFSITARLKPVN